LESTCKVRPVVMRALLLGTTNSPHVEDIATGLAQRGIKVVVGGSVAPNLPPSALPAQGIRIAPAPRGPAAPHVRLARRVRWLRRLLRDLRPDVVHAHELSHDPFVAVLAGARPLVATAWGSDVFLASRAQRLRARLVAHRADILTADSRALLDAIAELGADRSRLRIFNWGVDLDTFAPGRPEARERLGLSDRPIVLAPRALRPIYNPDTIVAAFDRLSAEFPDALLLIKYYGDLPPSLANLTRRDDVRVVGRVPADQLADYYRAADVCVSIPSSDSSPRTVWEAMACGCPCIVSDLPWVGQWIRDGREALVTAIDADHVAAAMGRVLRDGSLAGSLACCGRSLVEQHHDRRTQFDHLIAIYAGLARVGR
jgi:L-malate glycosyltransferase